MMVLNMVLWCQYCQKFIGEKEPFNDFTISHSICNKCQNKLENDISIDLKGIREISKFFGNIRTIIHNGEHLSLNELLFKAKELAISPFDLTMGIIAPLLHEVGYLYENGEYSVTKEHMFSQFVHNLIETITFSLCTQKRMNAKNTDMLLVCVNENYHSLGIQFLNLMFNQNNINCKTVFPSLPNGDIISTITTYNPSILGVSVATSSQLENAKQLLADIHKHFGDSSPHFLIGGHIINNNKIELEGKQIPAFPKYTTVEDMITQIKELLYPSMK